MNFDKFKNTFIELTSRTYPYGTENQLDMSLYLKNTKTTDTNITVTIGESRTIFSSHLDTFTSERVKVNHVIEENIIRTDGTTILGADDKAGVMVMLYMIEKEIPGNYIFFTGEERSCIGSKKFVSENKNFLKNIDRVVAFDRGGYNEISSKFCSVEGSSKVFLKRLKDSLYNHNYNFTEVDGGFCDATSFIDVVPECINLSVGYFKEHTVEESVDIKYLYEISEVYSNIEWEKLVPRRTPVVFSLDDLKNESVDILNFEELMLDDEDIVFDSGHKRLMNRILHERRILPTNKKDKNETSIHS